MHTRRVRERTTSGEVPIDRAKIIDGFGELAPTGQATRS